MLALAVTLLPAAAALVTPGCVIFVRHGQSEFNRANRFTGWINVPLTTEGRAEAAAGANWIEETSISFDVAFSSELQRAQDTAEILLEHCGQGDLPVACDWRLNERHYGALQGLSKDAAVQQYGREQVKAWRNSYTAVPPPMPRSDPGHPANDPLYASVPPASLPDAECLKDTLERCTPFWTERVEPCLRAGRNVLISAHGHSIRALVKHLDGVTDDDIARVSMPNGIPLLYRLRVTSDGALRPVPPSVRSIGSHAPALNPGDLCPMPRVHALPAPLALHTHAACML